jgi:nitrite reductase/ring-hydroxylating ferredoxin subunit
MTERGPFLTQPYGAYLNREVPREDVELTHVGPGTPAGEYLRRSWQPVAFSDELRDVPIPITVLGEELVVFRDGSGRVGVLQPHCAHRGTSLEYGLVSERGIRCCYHGWLLDVDGRILETPGEPAYSTLKNRLCQGAYRTHEHNLTSTSCPRASTFGDRWSSIPGAWPAQFTPRSSTRPRLRRCSHASHIARPRDRVECRHEQCSRAW